MIQIKIDVEKIQEAKKRLGDSAADIIADILNLENYDDRNKKACCPIHHENSPSFIFNSKNNSYHCFGCNANVDVIDAYMLKGNTYAQSVQKLFELTNIQYSFGEIGQKTKRQYYYPVPNYANNNEKMYSYLEKRKISRETADYLGLKQGIDGNILIQYYDLNDVLTMIKVRKSETVPKGGVKCWYLKDESRKPFDTTNILYNINRVNCDKPLLITSGELDAAAAIESGYYNTVSIPMGDHNTKWIEECFEFLEQFDSIILCPDNDDSGTKFCKEIVPRLGGWRCKIVNLPIHYTLDDGTLRFIKDLNECLYYYGKDKVFEIINAAEDTPIPSVKDFSDIDDVDLDEIDGIETGIGVLDKHLMKLFYGTVTILSGQPGSGKSSITSQILCNAMEHEKNIWLFTGEMPDYMAKNWINYILAGNRNIRQYEKTNGDKYYKIPSDVKTAINNHYRGKWFLYRDDWDHELDTLMNSMSDVVRKNGVKLLILDNLMTIDLEEEDDELREQAIVIKGLVAFAKKYNVAIVLVCHPRKLQNTTTVGMYDISGTSKIVNLAHRTIGMRLITPEEREDTKNYSPFKNYNVVVNIIKDRLRGKANVKEGLYYDPPSRRFFTSPEEYNYQYSWDKNVYDSQLSYPISDEGINFLN